MAAFTPNASAAPLAPPAWYATASYGLSMAIGAAVAVLGFAPKATWADALMVVGGLALLFTPAAAATGALRCQAPVEGRERLALSLSLAALLALPPLAVLGALLKAVTHHRGLGGVTFAILGLVVAAFALAVGGRAASWVASRRGLLPWARRISVGAAAFAALAAVAFAGWLRAGRLDVVLFLFAPVLGAYAPLIRAPWLGRLSWAVTALGAAVALVLALGHPLSKGVGQDVPLVDGVLSAARLLTGGEGQPEGGEGASGPADASGAH